MNFFTKLKELFQKQSALTKFFLPTAVIFFLLAIGIIVFSSITIRNSFINRTLQSIAQTVRANVVNLTPADFTLQDPTHNNEVFSAFFKKLETSEIIRIKVWSRKSEVIYSDDTTIVGQTFPDDLQLQQALKTGQIVTEANEPTKTENISEKSFKDLLQIYVPITFPGSGSPDGVVETYFNLANINSQIQTTQFLVVGAILISIGLSYIFLYFFFRIVIFQPLFKIKEVAGEFEKGELSKRLVIGSQDEIGQLANSFNNMAAKLQEYYSNLEEKVRERTQLIREVINANPNLIYVKDRNGLFTLINQALANIYGKTILEISGKLEIAVNPDLEEAKRSLLEDQEVLVLQKMKFIPEETIKDKEGKIHWFQIIKVPLISDGNTTHVLSVATDITERKIAELRTKELDDLKNKFIKIVSHQLRTPLGGVNWNLELLLDKEAGSLTAGQEDIIRIARGANTEAISRIDDLLKAMDIEEGRMTIDKEKTQMDSLLSSVLAGFKNALAVKRITVQTEFSKDIPVVEVDTHVLRDVFGKLIDNAITYTKEGGSIKLRLSSFNHTLRFEIMDTGIGVPPAEQQHIFERFHRGSNAFGMKPDASGLGLFIAKHAIEAHGGKIGFESTEGKGSTFWFELPVTFSNT